MKEKFRDDVEIISGGQKYGADGHAKKFALEFDMYIYDFGDDGIAGDPWEDLSGNDGVYNIGESYNAFIGSFEDNGLDGIPNTNDEGEGDGSWQPGDGWIDNGNGKIDATCIGGVDCDGYAYQFILQCLQVIFS